MKKTKFTEAQIVFALRQADTGTVVAEVCRKMGISEATFYNWKKKYGGLGVPELRRLRQLEPGRRSGREPATKAVRGRSEFGQADVTGGDQKKL